MSHTHGHALLQKVCRFYRDPPAEKGHFYYTSWNCVKSPHNSDVKQYNERHIHIHNSHLNRDEILVFSVLLELYRPKRSDCPGLSIHDVWDVRDLRHSLYYYQFFCLHCVWLLTNNIKLEVILQSILSQCLLMFFKWNGTINLGKRERPTKCRLENVLFIRK